MEDRGQRSEDRGRRGMLKAESGDQHKVADKKTEINGLDQPSRGGSCGAPE